MSVNTSPSTDNAIALKERILVSEDEACMLLGVSKPTLRSWVDEGILGPVQLPHDIRRRLYRRVDLEAWAANLDGAR
jgi:excisionase family DNA binding protein